MSMSHDEYLRYLESAEWKNKRDKRIEIDKGICQMCGGDGSEVHHFNYYRLGDEDPYKDLVLLCPSCHRLVHRLMCRVTDDQGHRGWKHLFYAQHIDIDK